MDLAVHRVERRDDGRAGVRLGEGHEGAVDLSVDRVIVVAERGHPVGVSNVVDGPDRAVDRERGVGRHVAAGVLVGTSRGAADRGVRHAGHVSGGDDRSRRRFDAG
jgi:hypothetical protein